MNLLDLLINTAEAATTTAATATPESAGNPMSTLFMFGAIFIFFYFVFIRPQSKRAKEHENLLKALAPQDEVVTSGGIMGTVTHVEDAQIKVAIANGIEILVQKQAITSVLPKGTVKF